MAETGSPGIPADIVDGDAGCRGDHRQVLRSPPAAVDARLRDVDLHVADVVAMEDGEDRPALADGRAAATVQDLGHVVLALGVVETVAPEPAGVADHHRPAREQGDGIVEGWRT